MTDDERTELLARFGYTVAWHRTGVVTDALLGEQAADLARATEREAEPDAGQGHRSMEHYRWAALLRYLRERAVLSDSEFDGLLEIGLAEVASAGVLRGSVLHELAKWPGLTDAQLAAVGTAWNDPGLLRVVRREQLLRSIAVVEPSGATVATALAEGDAHVHRLLLEQRLLSPDQLSWLTEHGATRAVRNMAAAALRGTRP